MSKKNNPYQDPDKATLSIEDRIGRLLDIAIYVLIKMVGNGKRKESKD